MESTAFLTDKYEVTMLQSALTAGVAHKKAVFELFARRLPAGRRYGVVGGIERAIQAVLDFRFTDEHIDFLRRDPLVNNETIEYLETYAFKGNIHAYMEGDVYFPYSPIMQVEGTFGECVLLETVLLSILNHDSAVMSAAARMVQAAKGVPVMEMGSRRTHEKAAVDSARAAYIAGFYASSNLESGLLGIPTSGTSAHAFTLAFEDEKEAFAAQVKALGVGTTLLVDTYDIEQGIRNAVEVAGTNLGGIRIDSGDLHEETVKARELLDSLGATQTKIVLSSDIDEFTIDEMMDRGTPVDVIGAGTRVVTGSGHPTAGMVFKLVEMEDSHGNMVPVYKKASGKKSIGGKKVAYRTLIEDETGIQFSGEFYSIGKPLPPGSMKPQKTFIENGNRKFAEHSIDFLRGFHAGTMNLLPVKAKRIIAGEPLFEAQERK